MKTIKWTGKEETLIRKEFGGEAFPVKPNGTIEVDERTEKELVNLYPDRIEVIESRAKAVVKDSSVAKNATPKKASKK